jgi:hypothetical protein
MRKPDRLDRYGFSLSIFNYWLIRRYSPLEPKARMGHGHIVTVPTHTETEREHATKNQP